MAAHTPGPWAIQDLSSNDKEGLLCTWFGIHGPDECQDWVCNISGGDWDPEIDQKYIQALRANLALIIAAPDLLAAIQRYLASIAVPTGYGPELSARLAEGAAAVEDMRAAVAKALGESEALDG